MRRKRISNKAKGRKSKRKRKKSQLSQGPRKEVAIPSEKQGKEEDKNQEAKAVEK